MERFVRIAPEIEQSLVIVGRAAGFLGILVILRRILRRPAGSVAVPEIALLLPGDLRHAQPCRLPVEHADALVAAVRHRLEHIGQAVRLSLDGDRIAEGRILGALGNNIAEMVAVVVRVGVGSLRDHDILMIGIPDLLHDIAQIVRRAVPVGVVGRREYVIIDLAFVQHLGVPRIMPAGRIREMQHL